MTDPERNNEGGEIEELRVKNQELASRVRELEETLEAIRSGEVDAIVVSTEDTKKIYTLEGPDRPYRALVETIPEGALTVSPDGIILYANERFASMVQVPPDKIIGTSLLDHISPGDLPAFEGAFRASPAGLRRERVTLRRVAGPLPVFVSMNPLSAEPGSKISVIVTDRKEDEAEIRESENRLRLAQEAGRIGVWDLDLATQDVRWTPELEAIYGVEPGSIHTYQDFLTRVYRDDVPKVEAALETARTRHRNFDFEFRITQPGGGIVWVYCRGASVFDKDGRATRVFGVNIDITERKRIEEALRKNEERLRVLYESMTEGLANHEVVYENGKAVDYIITDVNPAFERILGLFRSSAVGKRASDLYGTGSPPYLDVYARVASGGGPETFETYFPPMRQYFSVSAFSPGKGRFATVFTDITERKLSEDAMRKLAQFPGQDPNPVMRVASDGALLYANEAAGRWLAGLGWSKDEPLPPDLLALADSSHGDEREHLSEITDRRGRVFWLFAVRPPDEEYVNIYARDITDRKRAEEAMRESRERFRVLAENIPDLITRFDRDLRLLYVNPAVSERTGLPGEALVGRTASEYGASPAAACRWELAAREVLESGEPRRFEHLNDWQGKQRVFDTQMVPERDAHGVVRGVIAIARDITERKEMEDQQQVVLQRFYSILSSMHTAILLVTDDNRVEFANQAFCDIFGLKDPLEDLTKLSADEMIEKIRPSYLDPEAAVARIREMVHLGQPVRGEDVGMAGERTFLRDFIPLGLGEKRFGRLWIHTDITELKRAEKELRRKQSEIQALFDNIPAGLVLFDAAPSYTVLVHNRVPTRSLFAEPFQSQGMAGLSVYDYAPAVEAEGVVAVFDEVVRTKQAKSFLDFPYKSNPPDQSWFNWYIAPIILDGKVVALVSMSLDVTERHLADQALRESEERFRTVADNTYDWEFWLDPSGKFLYCSPSCEMVTGHKVTGIF